MPTPLGVVDERQNYSPKAYIHLHIQYSITPERADRWHQKSLNCKAWCLTSFVVSELIKPYANLKNFYRIISSMLYYAISIYSSDFSSDRFINLFLGGVAEFPACIIGFLLLKYIGRPRTALLLMWLCGISCIILPFVPKGG